MSKKRIVRALFDSIESLTPEEIASSDALKGLLKAQVPFAIREAFNSRKQYATIFEINSTSHFIEIHKKDWVKAIETCIIWYLESEEYEECSKLKDLIVQLQKKNIPIVKIKKEENE
jgi:hypothetical protein